MVKFEIHGLQEVYAALQELPARIEKNLLRRAMRQAANVLRDEARRLAPVDTGSLRRQIVVRDSSRKGAAVMRVVSASRRSSLLEYGTAAHLITPRRAKVLKIGHRYVRYAKHPGARAKPFMRPALDTKAQAAIQRFADEARVQLAVEVLGLPKRRGRAG